ncbi:MAG: MBL fold metallo-hydrolase, partial [Planctomycetes bacterium]|nr:MBL fold metallo-hydrolase [Planctomycetota bacterium]
EGDEPQELADGFLAIPTPGHTAGHCVLLVGGRFLFTGDHLSWNRHRRRLSASRSHCWHSWPQQVESLRRLTNHRFSWILPGHGQRVHLPAEEMQRELRSYVATL